MIIWNIFIIISHIIILSEIDPININDLESKSKAHNDDFNRVRADLIHSNDILTESIKSALLQFNDSKLPAYLLGIAQLSKSLNANSQSLIDLYKTKESKSNNNKVNESSYVVEDISTILNQQIKLN